MTAQEVPQGRYKSPFYERMAAMDTLNTWHNWKGYTVPDALYSEETEYFAIRNATGVLDLTPMTKYRITGPDALDYLNRLVTRDMAKIKPGRVAYAAWCDDRGQVLDDGTIFHLREGEYRLWAQERHYDWMLASAIGFDVTIVEEGDPSGAFFVLLSGSAAVRSGEAVVSDLGASDVLGEMGVLLGGPRTATVVASTPLVLLKFDAAVFDAMFERIPGFGVAICRALALRLADANLQVEI